MLSADAMSSWQKVLERIEKRTTTQQFATWFRNIQLQEVHEKKIVMAVPSTFHRDWIATYYKEILEGAVEEVFDADQQNHRDVHLVVAPRTSGSSRVLGRSEAESRGSQSVDSRRGAGRAEAPVLPGGFTAREGTFPLTSGLDFDHFVVGPSSQLAKAAGLSLVKESQCDFKVMLILASTGLGKTHVLQAIAREAQTNLPRSAKVAYIRAENFVNDFLQSLNDSDPSRFRDRYRNLDFVCFDDLQVLTGKDRTQQEFLHTLTAWLDRGARVVLAARCSPGEPLDLDPQLIGQLGAAFRVTLRPPDAETRRRIVESKARSRSEELPEDVVDFLSDLPAANVRELEGAVTSVIACGRLTGVPVSLRLARSALQHDSLVQRPVASPERILHVVCNHFDVKISDLTSPRRPQALSFARQVAMFLLRERTELSLSEIGSLLGGRDHTTILHGIRKIEKANESDGRLRDHLSRIRSILDH